MWGGAPTLAERRGFVDGSEALRVAIGLNVGLLVGVGGTLAGIRLLSRIGYRVARDRAQEIIASAELRAEAIRKEGDVHAKEEAIRRREAIDREVEEARKALREHERRLEKRDDQLDQKLDLVHKKELEIDDARRALGSRTEELDRRSLEIDRGLDRQREVLQRLAGLGPEEARQALFRRLEDELAHEVGGLILKHDTAMREASARKAREILAVAIQRYAAGHTAETTTSVVDIPTDDMKGRIIGREGRNIRAFEKATGVDVIVDDTPGVVIVSGFDNVRREIAKLSLEKLIQDGRIHPTRIEEVVAETQEEMETHIRTLGQQAAQEANVPGLHEKLFDYLGRLKFRTSYSQNVLRHSIEVAYLTGILAEEIGLDGPLGRRCGLLHDIGKAADHEMEGGHPAIGAELTKRFGEGREVIHAALGHHDDLRPETPYTVLVAAADAISASRPGARRETLEKYVRRLEELEGLVCGFPGVDQAYAIQAGREVRVIVDSHRVTDESAAKLARDIAKAIQEQLTYPGEVKVSVLRETRSVEFAR